MIEVELPGSPLSTTKRSKGPGYDSPLTPVTLRAALCLLLFIGELMLLYSGPNSLQTESCALQRGLQSLFQPSVEKTASTISRNFSEGLIPQGSTSGILMSNLLSSISERSATLFENLMSKLGLQPIERLLEGEHTTLPWGMYLAATLYRATSWRTWLAASSLLAWAYDHDMGVNLFTFMTFTQVAQSLARNIIGSPPGFWLCSTGPQQLCHSEGYSLPPENLTLALAFFLFFNYQLNQLYESMQFEDPELNTDARIRARKLRLRFFRIIGSLTPIAIALSTIYYGTHSLLDNIVGTTFAFLVFSVYRLWDELYLHASASNIWGEGEEDGSKNPDIKIQLIEREVERRAAMGQVASEVIGSPIQPPVRELSPPPSPFASWAASLDLISRHNLLKLIGGVALLGLVLGMETLIRSWDSLAMSQYPDSWKENLEGNCNLRPGAASFLMSLHSLGFGFARYANTAALAGLLLALALRDFWRIADSTTKHRPMSSLTRLIIGVIGAACISKALRWWLLEDAQHYPDSGRKETMESLVMHLELFLRPLWVIAISPLALHALGLGNYLDDFEDNEDFVILQAAEEKGRRRLAGVSPSSTVEKPRAAGTRAVPIPVSQSGSASVRQRPSTRSQTSTVVVEETTLVTPEGSAYIRATHVE